jgi:hypothetical protein
MQTPAHPSLAPHAFAAQSGTQLLAPQTFAPPPPHVVPSGQPPQSWSAPHVSVSFPQRPLHVAAGAHVVPPSAPASALSETSRSPRNALHPATNASTATTASLTPP